MTIEYPLLYPTLNACSSSCTASITSFGANEGRYNGGSRDWSYTTDTANRKITASFTNI